MICKHENIHTTSDGRRAYCTDCGEFQGAPGVTYYKALEDARRMQWSTLGRSGYVIRPGMIYVGTRYNEQTGTWDLWRCEWCPDCEQLEICQPGSRPDHRDHLPCPATHIALDPLGTPYDPAQSGLSSTAA